MPDQATWVTHASPERWPNPSVPAASRAAPSRPGVPRRDSRAYVPRPNGKAIVATGVGRDLAGAGGNGQGERHGVDGVGGVASGAGERRAGANKAGSEHLDDDGQRKVRRGVGGVDGEPLDRARGLALGRLLDRGRHEARRVVLPVAVARDARRAHPSPRVLGQERDGAAVALAIVAELGGVVVAKVGAPVDDAGKAAIADGDDEGDAGRRAGARRRR